MPGHDGFARPDPALIAELDACIRRLGGSRRQGGGGSRSRPLSMGVKALDEALPWGGLPRTGLHEIIAADSGVAAGGFCAALLARLIEAGGSGSAETDPPNEDTSAQGMALWCRRRRGLYGPGLALLGLDPARLIIVHARTDTDLFWTLEEALHSGALVGVLGEIGAAHPTALRRLQLAAESHGTMALLLRSQGTGERSAPTMTRWRVGAAPGGPPVADSAAFTALRDVRCRWQVELLRCKRGLAGVGGVQEGTGALQKAAEAGVTARQTADQRTNRTANWPIRWLVECDETYRLVVAAELRSRSADPAADARAKA